MKSKKVQFTEDQINWLNDERKISGYSANTLIRMAVDDFMVKQDDIKKRKKRRELNENNSNRNNV